MAPAAHYMMGGVRTEHLGRDQHPPASSPAARRACTGVHGANRLASNSLLEAWSSASEWCSARSSPSRRPAAPTADAIALSAPVRAEAPPLRPGALQTLMWEKVGIVRDGQDLAQVEASSAAWQATLPAPSDRPSHELSNLLTGARLMTEAALLREESRGAHYRTDFPEPREEWQRHIIFRRR